MFTELFKIIEGGLDRDKEKVISYSQLLANNLKEEGEEKIASKILKLIEKKNIHPVYLDELMATPVDNESRMSMVDILYPSNEEIEIVLPEYTKAKIDDFIASLTYKERIQSAGVDLISSLLLYGPPGCGKTSVAQYISEKTQLPLVSARLDSLISSLLGSTAKNIRKVFDFAKRKPCILFLDEFDAIAKARDDQHELGELKRVVNSLLQNIDEFNQNNILIAATNHHELLDSAIWRRFSTIVEIPVPEQDDIIRLLSMYLKNVEYDFKNDPKKIDTLAKLLVGLSPADIKTLCNNIIKKMIISNKGLISYSEYLYELYLFRNNGVISQSEIARFLNENGVPKHIIQLLLNISLRQVTNLLKE